MYYSEALITFIVILILAGIVVGVIFLLTLQNTLKQVSPENRTMEPGQVWLSLIPLFGVVWQFIVVTRLSDSVKAELQAREIPETEERPAYNIGIAYCALTCAGIIPIPVIGSLASLAGFVCWIIYWTKVSKYKTTLEHSAFAY